MYLILSAMPMDLDNSRGIIRLILWCLSSASGNYNYFFIDELPILFHMILKLCRRIKADMTKYFNQFGCSWVSSNQQQPDYSYFLTSLSCLPLGILLDCTLLISPVRILSLISLPMYKKTSVMFLFSLALTSKNYTPKVSASCFPCW